MGLMDELGGLLKQVAGGEVPSADVHAAFDEVSSRVPQSDMAEGLAHAFRSDQTPPFEQMLTGLFSHSNGDQKAGLLNQLLGGLGSGGLAQALGGVGGLAGLAGLLGGGSVTPQQAQQIPPEAVQALAQHAAQQDPSIVDRAADFYAQHPALVKSIGAGALALLLSRVSAQRR